MQEMLGDDQKAISSLFRSLEEWEYCNFVAEYFSNPTVIEKASDTDEQAVKLATVCAKMSVNNVRILDGGGGAGRLGKCLKLIASKNETMPRYRYEIYEPFVKNSTRDQEFATYSEVKQIAGKYEFVVLMNVLHEIGVRKWAEIFSQIRGCLKDDGYLIFAEAKNLQIGEQPYCENGYLVLGEKEIRELLKPYKNADRICALHMETGREDKSEFLMIPADEIRKITEAKIRKALECLKCEMFQKLKVMDKERIACVQNDRQPSFTYRKYAFVAQQYVNVSMGLENECTFNNAMPSNTRINRTKYVNVSNDSKAAQKNENNLINNMGNFFNIKLSGWEDEK